MVNRERRVLICGAMFSPNLLAAFSVVLALVAGDATPPEKVLSGSEEAVIWIVSKRPRVKVETHNGFIFHLDFATHGALSLANICANLHTEPKGVTLSLDPVKGLLSVDYDNAAKELRVLMGSGAAVVCKLSLPLTAPTTRVLLRQRDQLALYAIPLDGSRVTPVWFGAVDYVVHFRNADQYELCRDLKIAMGGRELSLEKLRAGIALDALDEIADVTVSGTNPAGASFKHHYTFDYEVIAKSLDQAYTKFLRFAGNADADAPAEAAKPTLEKTE
jgi:hypothetical protein